MRPDYIYCGTCSLEVPLSDLPFFIEHKRSNCGDSFAEKSNEDLQCSQCVRTFHTAWPLLYHIQNDHGVKVVRNLHSPNGDGNLPVSGLTTPNLSFDQMDDPFARQPTEDNCGHKNNVDIPPRPPPNIDSTDSSILPFAPVNNGPMKTSPCECCNEKSPSLALGSKGVQICSLSYESRGCNLKNVPLNLEDSLRLIHRIACSKLDMHLRNMATVEGANTSSAYALSLCCSQAGVSCTVGSCMCSVPNDSKTSKSSQTDGVSDPRLLELLTAPDFSLSPDKGTPSLMDIDRGPLVHDFGFISSLTQAGNTGHNDIPLHLFESTVTATAAPVNPIHSHTHNSTAPMQTVSTQSASVTPTPTTSPPVPNTNNAKVVPFTCSFCGRMYRQKIHLRKHIMAQHTKQKPFYCPHCSYATVEKSHLTVHIRTHTGERPYTCRVCNYSSTQNCTLKSHYLRRHPDNKLNCVECGGAYVTELEYHNHLKNCSNFQRV